MYMYIYVMYTLRIELHVKHMYIVRYMYMQYMYIQSQMPTNLSSLISHTSTCTLYTVHVTLTIHMYILIYRICLLRQVVSDASGGPKPLILPLELLRLCLGVSSVDSNSSVMDGGRVRVWSPVRIR